MSGWSPLLLFQNGTVLQRGRRSDNNVSSLCIKKHEQQVNCCCRGRGAGGLLHFSRWAHTCREHVTGACCGPWRAAPCGCRWGDPSERWGPGTAAGLGLLTGKPLVATNTTRDRWEWSEGRKRKRGRGVKMKRTAFIFCWRCLSSTCLGFLFLMSFYTLY